jgi:hypothetical protein
MAGVEPGGGLAAGYQFAPRLNLPVADSPTAGLTTPVACGPSLVMALEAEGSRRRCTLVAGLCAVTAAFNVAVCSSPGRAASPADRSGLGLAGTALAASALSIAVLSAGRVLDSHAP